MAALGAALTGFAVWSHLYHKIPGTLGWFPYPPLYGAYVPVFEKLSFTVIPAAIILAVVAWVATSGRFSRRVPSWLVLALLIGAGVLTAAAIAVVRGDPDHLTRGIATGPKSRYYTSDLHFVSDLGVRRFIEQHPELTELYHSYNSKTHPAGVLVLLHVLFRIFGASHPLRIATAIAVLAMLGAVAAWMIGRELGGERAGRIAAVLFVAAPGPLMLAYTGLDAVFATCMAFSAAVLMMAIRRQSAAIMAAGGAVLAATTLLTYATVFMALATGLTVILQTRSVRTSLRLLGTALGAGVLVIALAWAVLGMDVIASYLAVPEGLPKPYDPYWIVGAPAAWLMWAGLPIAAMGVAGLWVKAPRLRQPMLILVLVIIMVTWAGLPQSITKLRSGEVERTWAFLYPMLAGTAGPLVERWTRGAGRASGAVVSGLVLLAVAQAAVIQALWDNFI